MHREVILPNKTSLLILISVSDHQDPILGFPYHPTQNKNQIFKKNRVLALQLGNPDLYLLFPFPFLTLQIRNPNRSPDQDPNTEVNRIRITFRAKYRLWSGIDLKRPRIQPLNRNDSSPQLHHTQIRAVYIVQTRIFIGVNAYFSWSFT
jgi:hypothetical protein